VLAVTVARVAAEVAWVPVARGVVALTSIARVPSSGVPVVPEVSGRAALAVAITVVRVAVPAPTPRIAVTEVTRIAWVAAVVVVPWAALAPALGGAGAPTFPPVAAAVAWWVAVAVTVGTRRE
jgi:hypothetical protein